MAKNECSSAERVHTGAAMALRARGGGLKMEWVLLVSVCLFTLVAHIRLSSSPPHRHQQLDLCAAREAEARRAGADAAVKHIRSQTIVRANLPPSPAPHPAQGLKPVHGGPAPPELTVRWMRAGQQGVMCGPRAHPERTPHGGDQGGESQPPSRWPPRRAARTAVGWVTRTHITRTR